MDNKKKNILVFSTETPPETITNKSRQQEGGAMLKKPVVK